MKLKEFVEKYIERNSLVRLVYSDIGGHEFLSSNVDHVCMEHEIVKGIGIYASYINNDVIGIASILVDGNYTESINIVIKRIDGQPIVSGVSYSYVVDKTPIIDSTLDYDGFSWEM